MKENKGIGVVEGYGLANALQYVDPIFDVNKNIDTTIDCEKELFERALQKVQQEIKKIISYTHGSNSQEKCELLEVQLEMAQDPSLIEDISHMILQGYNALYAANKIFNLREQELLAVDDAYFRERSADVKDLGTRLCCYIAGKEYVSLRGLNQPVIIVAKDLPPSLLLSAPEENIKGIVLEEAGKTSHVVIVASGLGIPTVIGCKDVDSMKGMLFVDGFAGKVVPVGQEDIAFYAEIIRKFDETNKQREKLQHIRSVTLDGKVIRLAANITGLGEAKKARELGAEGVGLFRTEFLYMNRSALPSCKEQADIYSEVARLFSQQDVIIRTLDIGGDKKSGCLDLEAESGFLGYRAIRICLDRPEMFLQQLKACLLASQVGQVDIMVPMVSSQYEILQTRQLVEKAASALDMADWNRKIRIGAMIEIPSAAICADQLAQCCDFFSIGTNDLTQYTLAADRNNARVAMYYSWFSPAVLRLIQITAQAAQKAKIMCGVCGEVAADPRATSLLIGLGVSELSVPPAKILQIREAILKVDTNISKELAAQALSCSSYREVEALLDIV